MTERWQAELERLERLRPNADLVERARQRPLPPLPAEPRGRRIGAIAVAGVLTAGLVLGGFLLLRDRTPETTVVVTPPAVVENGELLFARHTGEAWHVVALDPDTGVERELTGGVRDYGSDWSPDGTKIVYDTDDGAIVIADADGSNAAPVATGQSPAWSPDGMRIAYAGDDGDIWVVNVDGTDAHPVTDASASGGETMSYPSPYDWSPSWSPDGRSIAYTRLVSDRLAPLPQADGSASVTLEELRVWSEEGTDVVLTDAYAALGGIDWSPDGSTLVFTGAPTLFHEESTKGMLWPRVLTIPASGGEVTPITPEDERWIGGATWSPDGEWIAFQDDYETIAMIRPDGSDRTEIVLGYEVIGLSWGVEPPEA